MLTDQKLNEEEVWFELSSAQKRYYNRIVKTNSVIREGYHAIHQLMWLSKYQESKIPPR